MQCKHSYEANQYIYVQCMHTVLNNYMIEQIIKSGDGISLFSAYFCAFLSVG